jgi:hypothetical protein
MRRLLLICLSLVLALVGGSAACAEDGFYVIGGGGKSASVPKTGQTTSYGPRDDGALQKGVAWPTPRFTDNGNGTVTDNLTRLIWMKNASAFGTKTWADALSAANGLKSGDFDLTDGSKAGDWRLPNRRELFSLVDDSRYNPALPAVNPFTNVKSAFYWSSSTYADATSSAWDVGFYDGYEGCGDKSSDYYMWPVRGGP